jgi:epsilon-lactone hydrolase
MYDNYDPPICNRGITTDSEAVPEMQHMFPFLPGTAPEGDAAIHRVADGVRPKLGPA